MAYVADDEYNLHTNRGGYPSTKNRMPKFPISKGMQDELAHVQLPRFESSFTAECLDEYLFWILEVDKVLDSLSCSEVSKYHCVVNSLTGLAKLWWDGTQILRIQQGKMKINTWTAMRNILQQCFYSEEKRNYQLNLLAHSSQGDRSVSDYADEFQMLAFRSSVRESSPQCIDLFLQGLKPEISTVARDHQHADFCDAVLTALKIEKRLKRKNKSVLPSDSSPSYISPSSHAESAKVTTCFENISANNCLEQKQIEKVLSSSTDDSNRYHISIGTMLVPLQLTPHQPKSDAPLGSTNPCKLNGAENLPKELSIKSSSQLIVSFRCDSSETTVAASLYQRNQGESVGNTITRAYTKEGTQALGAFHGKEHQRLSKQAYTFDGGQDGHGQEHHEQPTMEDKLFHLSETVSMMQTMLQSFEIAHGQHEHYREPTVGLCCSATTWSFLLRQIRELNKCESNNTLHAATTIKQGKKCVLQDGIYHYYHMNGD